MPIHSSAADFERSKSFLLAQKRRTGAQSQVRGAQSRSDRRPQLRRPDLLGMPRLLAHQVMQVPRAQCARSNLLKCASISLAATSLLFRKNRVCDPLDQSQPGERSR